MDFANFSVTANLMTFLGSTLVIVYSGTKLAALADQLADRTGWGEAITGAVLLGASTSLPGLVVSVSAAAQGFADMAVSNAIGGIAAQTMFLAVADLVYRRANLEHAAASLGNLIFGIILIILLSAILLATNLAEITVWDVHPATAFLVAFYLFSLHLARKAREHPMWLPQQTSETIEDKPEPENERQSLSKMAALFVVLATVLGTSGWIVG